VQRRKFVYLCTNALLLEEQLPKFTPTKYLAFSIHMDGPRAAHDQSVCRAGVFDQAIDAIRAARRRGFRVTTNTTFFAGFDVASYRQFFDEMMDLGVEGMMVSPGYSYAKAPDQKHFLAKSDTQNLFRQLLSKRKASWRFNQTPLFLEFLQGKYSLDCTPWGNPTYNVFGWQKPCYLLDEGYCDSYKELVEGTDWSRYGHASKNPKCADCLVHCGFEPSAVAETFGTWRGFATTTRATLQPFIKNA